MRRISSAALVISSGSRNSSTYRIMRLLKLCRGLLIQRPVFFRPRAPSHTAQFSRLFQTISANFVHGSLTLSEHSEQLHLFRGILLADFGHCKSHVDKHPVANLWHVFDQQTEIDPASYAGDLDDAKMRFVRNERHDPSRNR